MMKSSTRQQVNSSRLRVFLAHQRFLYMVFLRGLQTTKRRRAIHLLQRLKDVLEYHMEQRLRRFTGSRIMASYREVGVFQKRVTAHRICTRFCPFRVGLYRVV